MELNIELLAFVILKEIAKDKTDVELLHSVRANTNAYYEAIKQIPKEPPEPAKVIKRPF